MNQFYKLRYEKFIDSIKLLGERSFTSYTEVHHIVPKCLHGSNDKENLIRLTLREHFLAHWLLWKAYPNYLPVASAFLQMNNKNPKLPFKGFQGRINSNAYEKLKIQVYRDISKLNSDKVYVKNKNGEIITMSKDEYAAQDELTFHTSKKIYAFDKEANQDVYIDTDVYHKEKAKYVLKHIMGAKYQFFDIDDNRVVMLTKKEAKSLNIYNGYKKYKQIANHQIACTDKSGERLSVSLIEYKSNEHLTHINCNKFSVFDTIENKTKQISKEEYLLNQERYITSTKGKVLAKDKDGNTCLITKEDFQKGNYVGITKGLRTVFDKKKNSYTQITADEFIKNQKDYVWPNQGKVNVINKLTGERKQIHKSEFDKSLYSSLGNKKFLFKCKHKLTGKEKNVNIYEWDILKDNYEIIDYEKYKRALNEK